MITPEHNIEAATSRAREFFIVEGFWSCDKRLRDLDTRFRGYDDDANIRRIMIWKNGRKFDSAELHLYKPHVTPASSSRLSVMLISFPRSHVMAVIDR